MKNFTIHTNETAPEGSKQALENARNAYGFLPGLLGVLAEAPKALEAYQVLGGLIKETSLTTTEQHVVLLAVNYENNCGYCMPAHTGLAKLDKVSDDVIEALRSGTPISDARLQALRVFTTMIVQKRGWVSDEDTSAFLGAGFKKQQILEVILGVSFKVISNYTNHVADTPVDAVFKKFAWEKPAQAEAVARA